MILTIYIHSMKHVVDRLEFFQAGHGELGAFGLGLLENFDAEFHPGDAVDKPRKIGQPLDHVQVSARYITADDSSQAQSLTIQCRRHTGWAGAGYQDVNSFFGHVSIVPTRVSCLQEWRIDLLLLESRKIGS
mgnify:CR=1 FL=1